MSKSLQPSKPVEQETNPVREKSRLVMRPHEIEEQVPRSKTKKERR